MIVDILAPSPGESINEVEIASWLAEDGSYVEKDQEIGQIESEKATLPIIASESGKLMITAAPGTSIEVGAVVCRIDTSVVAPRISKPDADNDRKTDKTEEKTVTEIKPEKVVVMSAGTEKVKITPVAKNMMKEYDLSIDDVLNGIRRLVKEDIEAVLSIKDVKQTESFGSRELTRNRMSSLRRKLSERLVAVKNETAMLTTFNEVDMSAVLELRKKYQDKFVEMHGIKLGFMSFFTKAVTESLKKYPLINSYIEGEEIVSPKYMDVGIAVQTDKGLMVPVLRNAESMSLPGIEHQIANLAAKARAGKLSIDEMTGGTFTITNGGIFGSLLSTPILNPPQSGILGMHNVVERPIAVNGKVEIRPIMYIAFSYDHRIIDGRDSVGFLISVKKLIENPVMFLFGNEDPERKLLGI